MKAWQVACIAGVIASTGLYLAAGNRTVATVPDAMPEAAVNAVTTYAPALSAAVPTVSAGPGTTLAAEDGLVTASVSDALMARAEIAGYSIGPKLASLGHQDVAQPGAYGDAGFPVSHLLRLVRTSACRKAGGDRLAFVQGHPGRNAGRGDQARCRRVWSRFQFHESGCQDRVRLQPQSTHGVVYRPVPAERIRVRQIRLRADFAVRATMPLRPLTR